LVDPAKVRKAVLGPHRPIVGHGILEAATDRPPDTRGRAVSRAEHRSSENVGAEDRDLGVEAAEGNAAGRIDQDAVPSDTEPASDRTLDIERRMRIYCTDSAKDRNGGHGGLVEVGAVDRTFETDDHARRRKPIPPGDLIIVPDIAASDYPTRITAASVGRERETGTQPQASMSCWAIHSAVGCVSRPAIRFDAGREIE
jgi:hypothetical protein